MKRILFTIFFGIIASSFLLGQVHFVPNWTGNGVDHMNFYITEATINGIDLEVGDEIGIYDGSNCVGVGVLTETLTGAAFLSIVTSKDDELTPEIDGFTPGNPIFYQLWDSSTDTEADIVTPTYPSATPVFTASGTASAELAGLIYLLQVAPTDITLAYSIGSSSGFNITSENVSWSITGMPTWITISSTTGSTSEAITVTTSEVNPTSIARSATLTISGNGLSEIVTITQDGAPSLDVSPSSLGLAYTNGSSNTFNITSLNTSWNITSDQTWLDVDITTGSGDLMITTSADSDNPTSVERVGTITVTGSGITRTVTVTQAGAPSLSVSTPTLSLAYTNGSNDTFEVTSANVSWNITDIPSWLNVTPLLGSSSQTISVTTNEENPGTTERSAVLTISGGGITRTVTVTQAGAPSLEVSTTSLSVTFQSGSNAIFNVTSENTSWTVSSSQTWLDVSPASGTSSLAVTVTANADNPGTTTRSANVNVTNGTISHDITVTQDGAPSLEVSPTGITLAFQSSSTATFDITAANVTWSASSSETWATVSSSSGSASQTITVTAVSANPSTSTRAAVITVTGAGFTRTVNVTQEGASDLSVNPTSVNLLYTSGSSGSFNITSANITWNITGMPTWIGISSTTGTASESITVTTNEVNPSTTARSAILTISDGTLSSTVTITQAGAPSLTVSTSSIALPYTASAGGFDITSENTSWNISDDAPWIDVTPTSGSTNLAIAVNANSDNPSTVERVGTITITGSGITRTVTVTQAGAPSLSLSTPTLGLAYTNGSNNAFDVTSANVSWDITGIPSWINVSPLAGTSSQTISVTTNEENPGTTERSAVLTVSGGGITRTVTVTQAGAPSLEVSTTSLSVTFQSGSNAIFNVSSENTSWTVSSSQTWLDVSPASGTSSLAVTVTANADNPGTTTRSATVNVTNGTISHDITVTQDGAPSLEVSPTGITLAFQSSSTATFDITAANVTWSASSSETWATVSSSSGSASQTITVTAVSANPSTSTRAAVITVTGAGFTRTVNVTQEGASDLSVNPTSVNLLYTSGSSGSFNITSANITWNITGMPTWIDISSTTGSASESITVTTNEVNPSTTARSAILTISDGTLSSTVTITQAGAPSLTVSTSSIALPYTTSAGGFDITSENTSWNISDDAPWIDVTPTSGSTNLAIAVNANSDNPSTVERVGTITVTGSGITRTVTVTQAGAPSLSVSTPTLGLAYTNGSNNAFDVTSANVSWDITGIPSWINVSPLAGTSSQTISVTTNEENPGTTERSAVLTVSGGGITRTVTVTQAGAPSLEVSTTSLSVTFQSGSNAIFNVTSENTSWTVSSSQTWLDVSPASGTSSLAVTVTANADNPGTTTRSANVNVTNGTISHDITVTQDGAPSLEVSPTGITLAFQSSSTATFDITAANVTWSASSSETWATVSSSSGSASQTITVTAVSANPSTSTRAAVITVTGAGFTRTVNVTQEGASDLSVNPTSVNLLYTSGSSGSFNITSANITWNITGMPTWIGISSTTGTASESITVTTNEVNPSTTARSAILTISDGTLSSTVTITQAGAPSLTVSTSSIALPYTASAGGFDITSENTSWNISDDAPWIDVTPTSGSTNLAIAVNANSDNPSTVERVGTITITGSGITRTVTVTQAGAPSLSLSTPTLGLAYTNGSNNAFDVTSANVSWDITGIPSWINVSPLAGTSSQTISVTTNEENPGTTERSAVLTVSGGGITRTVTVTQAGAPSLEVSTTSLSVTFQSGSNAIFNVSSENTSWTVSSSQTWLDVSPASGTSSLAVTVTANADNPGTTTRSATVNVTNGTISHDITVTQDGAPSLEVSPTGITLAFQSSSTATFDITAANVTWSASSSETWATVSSSSGSASQTITVTAVSANPSTSTRAAVITVTGAGFTRTVNVTQEGASDLSVNPTSVNLLYTSGSSGSFNITSANITWNITGMPTWIDISSTTGSASESITVTTNEVNPSTTARSAILTISDGTLSSTVTITQAGAPSLTVSTSSIALPYTASAGGFDITSENTSWNISDDAPWIDVTPTSGSTNMAITVNANSDNPSTVERVGTITVTGSGITRTVTVTQAGAPSLSVSTPTLGLAYTNGSNNAFDVTSANVSWDITGIPSWINVSPLAGTSSQTISVTTNEENPGTTERSAVLTISGGGITRTVTVTQDGAPSLEVSTTSLSVTFQSGSNAIFNVTSENTSWTVSSSQTWLDVSPASGTSSLAVTVTANADNPGTTTRSATVNVTNGTISHDITVTQDGAPSLEVSPTGITLAFQSSSTATFDITAANVTWSASSSETWATVSSSSGSASQTITVTAVSANPSTSTRAAVITVTGAGFTRTVNVTQEGASDLSVNPTSVNLLYTSGSSGSFNITSANITWNITGMPTWIGISSTTGSASESITVTTNEVNPSTTARSAILTISDGTLSSTVTITQAGAPSLTVSTSSIALPYTASAGGFDITSENTSWNISDDAPWIDVTPTSGSTNLAIAVNANSDNPSTVERVGTITITGSGITRTVTVTQAGAPSLYLSTPTLGLAYTNGSSASFNVTSANLSWVVNGIPSWINVVPASGSGDQSVLVTANSDNPSTSTRSATLSVEGAGLSRTVTVTQDGAPSLEVSTTSLSVTFQSGSNAIFNVTSENTSWTVSSSQTWLDVSPASGTSSLAVTVTTNEANPGTTTRSAIVTVTNGTISHNIIVTQDGAPLLEVSPTSITLAFQSSSTATFDITAANVTWSASSSETWATVSSSSGSASQTITVTAVSANPSTSTRAAVITVTGAGFTRTVNVTQEGASDLSVNPTSVNLAYTSGATGAFNITSANITWNITGMPTWIGISSTTGTASESITVTTNEVNPSTIARSTTLTISDGTLSSTVTITQAGAPSLTVSTSSIALPYTASAGGFDITSENTSWNISNDATWIDVTPTSGSTNLAIAVNANSDNPSTVERVGTITITGSGITRTVTVTQAGAPSLSLSTPTLGLAYTNGSSASFNVTSANLSWVVNGIPSWINVVPASGSGDQSVLVTANSDNPSTSTRSATLSVEGAGLSRTVTVTQAGAPSLEVSTTSLSVTFQSGSNAIFNVTSENTSWTISDNATWLVVSPSSGGSSLPVTVTTNEANPGTTTRSAIVTVTNGTISHNIIVTQNGSPLLEVSPTGITLAFQSSSTATFDITAANVAWSASSSETWATVSSSSGSASQTITVTAVSANPSTSTRAAVITVTGAGFTRTVNVTQEGASDLSVNPTSVNLAYTSGATGAFNITSANITWNITGMPTWIGISSTTGSASESITVTTNEVNPSTIARSTTLTISDGSLSSTVTITQAGAPSLTVSTSSIALPYTASVGGFNITSENTSWNISDDAPWIDVTPTSGSTNLAITVNANSDNPSTVERVGTITVTGSGFTRTVTVTQAGAPSLEVSPNSLTIGSADGSNDSFVLTSANVSWGITGIPSWLNVSPLTGTSSQTISVTASGENLSINSRTAVLSVAGGGITRTVTVTQEGATPVLTVTPESQIVGSSSGTFGFAVTSNVDWTFSGGDSWIIANKSDASTLTVTFTENITVIPRSTTITLSGPGVSNQVITLEQEGATPALIVNPTGAVVGSADGSITFSVTSNINWTLSENSSWITAIKTSETTLTVDYNENLSITSRSATITVSGPGVSSQTINIDQEAADPFLNVSPPSVIVNSLSGITIFTVSSNIDWSFAETSDWINAVRTNETTLTVTYNVNATINARTATILITGPGVTDQMVSLNQNAGDPVLLVTPTTATVPAASGTMDFSISSNFDWSISENADWLTATKIDNATLRIIYDENLIVTLRTANITLSGEGLTQIVTFNQNAATPVLLVTPASETVTASSGSVNFTVTSNVDWNFTENSAWFIASKINNTTLTVTYNENLSVDTRISDIVISGPGVTSQTVTLEQDGATPILEVTPTSQSVSEASGIVYFTISSNIIWTFSENESWVTATKINEATLRVTYDENLSVDSRSVSITLSGPGVSNAVATLNQDGATPVLLVSPSSQSVASTAGSISFSVSSNIIWTLSENSSWFDAIKTNETTLTVNYNANSSVDSRVGDIILSGPGVGNQTVSLNQQGANPELVVNPASRNVSANPGSTTFSVSSNVNWAVSENVGWLVATKTNETTLTISFDENMVIVPRSANITLTGPGISSQTVTLNQEGATPVLNVSPNSESVSASSGSVTFNVSSNVDWVLSENADWFTAVKSNSSTLTVTYNENISVIDRSATITLSGTSVSSQIITLNQAGAAPVLTVNPESRTVSSASGTYSFTVSSNIIWTFNENISWLTAIKSDNTTLTISYEENISVDPRSANVTLSGPGVPTRTISLEQLGATPTLVANPASSTVSSFPGSISFNIVSNVTWNFSENSDWLSASKIDNGTLLINYDLNASFTSRTASITLTGPGINSQTIDLTQLGSEPILSVFQPFASVGSNEGSVDFVVKSNINWSITENYNWLIATKSDNATLTISYDKNILTESRIAVVTLSGPGVNPVTVTLTQEESGPVLSVESDEKLVSSSSGTVTFTVISNVNWSVSENNYWTTAVKTNSTTLTIQYDENLLVESRIATFGLSGQGVSPLIVTLNQEGASPIVRVTPESATVGASSGSINFAVSSNIDWIISEDSEWLSAIKSDNNTLTVTYNENISNSSRYANINVTGPGVVAQTIILTQQGANIVLEASPVSATVTSIAGSYTFTVNANIDWSISTDQSWTSVTKESATSFRVDYDENTGGESRTAILTLSGEGASSVPVTFIQESPTAIEEFSTPEISIKLYPNPTDGIFNIEITDLYKDRLFMDIYDRSGRKLLQKVIDYPTQVLTESFNFSGSPKGIYFIRIHDGSEWSITKVLVVQ